MIHLSTKTKWLSDYFSLLSSQLLLHDPSIKQKLHAGWIPPPSEPPVPGDAFYAGAQNYYSQTSCTWRPRQVSEASMHITVQTRSKSLKKACNCKYIQLEKSTTGGGPQQWRQLPAAQRCGGTGGPRHPPPASRWKQPPHPSWFFHLSYSSKWV